MSSSGATKNKPKKTSTLRILWIPGRKKHNRKGGYNSTKSGIPQNYGHQQKKIESWSLGGTLNHSKIINAKFFFRDPHDSLDIGGMATAATGAIGLAAMAGKPTDGASSRLVVDPSAPSTSQQQQQQQQPQCPPCNDAGGIELNNLNGDVATKLKDIPTSNQFETLQLIDEEGEQAGGKDRNYSNAESASSLLSSNNESPSSENMHNTATLSISEQRRRRRRYSYNSKRASMENLDSIDHINEVQADVTNETLDLQTDAAASRRQKKKTKKRNRSKARQREEEVPAQFDNGPARDETGRHADEDPNERLVTCLYYTLVCCDCNIS